jgi:hypothetical protein
VGGGVGGGVGGDVGGYRLGQAMSSNEDIVGHVAHANW